MPLYVFSCSLCQKEIEVLQGYNDERPTKHEECGGVLTQKFGIPAKYVGPNTVGSLAEKNSKRFSEDYKNHLIEESRAKRPPSKKAFKYKSSGRKPISREKAARLNQATKQQKEKYIETGTL